jgi:hypothetical protein
MELYLHPSTSLRHGDYLNTGHLYLALTERQVFQTTKPLFSKDLEVKLLDSTAEWKRIVT